MPTPFFTILQHRNSIRRTSAGFTLIELMVTIAIVAILTTLALPAMRDYLLNQSIKTASFDLMSTLLYARSEAIKRSTTVVVVPASASGTAAWHNGWSVYAGACTTTSGTSLRTHDSLPNLNIPASTTNPYCYGKDGHISSTGALAVITVNISPSKSTVNPRCVSIDLSGLPTTTVSTTGTCP